MTDDPILQPIRLLCNNCGHEWSQKVVVMVPVSVWTAHVRSIQCPECGAGRSNLLIRANASPA